MHCRAPWARWLARPGRGRREAFGADREQGLQGAAGAAGCCRAGSGAAGCCRECCAAGTGAARGCCSGSGVSGTGWSTSPPGAAQPPPPPAPSVGGQGRHRYAAMRQGVAGQQLGQTVSGAPRSTGARQPVCRPAGGLLSLGFTRQVQPSGGGDAQPPTAAPAGADGGAHSPRSGQGRSLEDPT